MNRSHLARLEVLESRLLPRLRQRSNILSKHALERLTYEELCEISGLFEVVGVEEIEELPADAQDRIAHLVEDANTREPAPWPASSPDYKQWAEHVQSTNPATAGLPGP
jgi:hypothetical protein